MGNGAGVYEPAQSSSFSLGHSQKKEVTYAAVELSD